MVVSVFPSVFLSASPLPVSLLFSLSSLLWLTVTSSLSFDLDIPIVAPTPIPITAIAPAAIAAILPTDKPTADLTTGATGATFAPITLLITLTQSGISQAKAFLSSAKKKNKNERIEDNVKPNLLNRNFTTDSPNKVWDTDVTYLIFKGARAYLSTIIDLYDRKVIAYKISKHNDNKLVMDTLNEAISKRKDVSGLILHSDQGFQYTSVEYKVICSSNGITISMSRKGTPIDDSPMESWHGILKKETLHNNNITSLQEYQKLVEDWILFYNTDRLKSKK